MAVPGKIVRIRMVTAVHAVVTTDAMAHREIAAQNRNN
jgi:hypothetical protein